MEPGKLFHRISAVTNNSQKTEISGKKKKVAFSSSFWLDVGLAVVSSAGLLIY